MSKDVLELILALGAVALAALWLAFLPTVGLLWLFGYLA